MTSVTLNNLLKISALFSANSLHVCLLLNGDALKSISIFTRKVIKIDTCKPASMQYVFERDHEEF